MVSDINECQIGLHSCKVLERCDNTAGSYHCTRIYGCGTGYTLNSHNGLCEDDDECALGTHNCGELGENFECRNTLGSYRCSDVRYGKPKITSNASISTTTKTKLSPTTTTTIPVVTNLIYPSQTVPEQSTTTKFSTTRYTTSTTKLPTVSHPKLYVVPYPSTANILPYSARTTPVPPARVFSSLQYPIITGQLKKCLPGYTMNSRGECEGKLSYRCIYRYFINLTGQNYVWYKCDRKQSTFIRG